MGRGTEQGVTQSFAPRTSDRWIAGLWQTLRKAWNRSLPRFIRGGVFLLAGLRHHPAVGYDPLVDKPEENGVETWHEDAATGEPVATIVASQRERYAANVEALLFREPDMRLPASKEVRGISDDQQRYILADVLSGISPVAAARKVGISAEHLKASRECVEWDDYLRLCESTAVAELERSLYLEAVGRAKHVKRETKYEVRGKQRIVAYEKVTEIEKPPNEKLALKWLESRGIEGWTPTEQQAGNFTTKFIGVGGETTPEEKELVQRMREQAKRSIAYIVASEEDGK